MTRAVANAFAEWTYQKRFANDDVAAVRSGKPEPDVSAAIPGQDISRVARNPERA
jgi:hypothetical protein